MIHTNYQTIQKSVFQYNAKLECTYVIQNSKYVQEHRQLKPAWDNIIWNVSQNLNVHLDMLSYALLNFSSLFCGWCWNVETMCPHLLAVSLFISKCYNLYRLSWIMCMWISHVLYSHAATSRWCMYMIVWKYTDTKWTMNAISILHTFFKVLHDVISLPHLLYAILFELVNQLWSPHTYFFGRFLKYNTTVLANTYVVEV